MPHPHIPIGTTEMQVRLRWATVAAVQQFRRGTQAAVVAALEQRMIAAAPIVLEATAEVSDDAGELLDGDAAQDGDDRGDGCVDDAAAGDT
jgi:hypothetical protein